MSTRTTLLAVTLLAAACGSSSPPKAGPAPLDNRGGEGAPLHPAPQIAVDGDLDFTSDGLPAISADGTRIVHGQSGADGGRGAPNFKLVVQDGADATVHEIVVLSPDDYDPDAPPPGMAERLEEANRYLRETNETLRWQPLARLAVEDPPEDRMGHEAQIATLDDVRVEYVEPRLLITHAGATLVDRQMPAWMEQDQPMCDGCPETCTNPSWLGAAFVDLDREMAILWITYSGHDTCWEPDDRVHVVSW